VSDWRFEAACLDEDPDLFFPVGNTGPAILQIEDAKAVCRRCDVVETCLRWALDTGQEAGVWGGLSEDERRALKRRGARAAARAAGRVPRELVDATDARDALRKVVQTGISLSEVSRRAEADGHAVPHASLSDVEKGRRTRIDRGRSAAVLAACEAVLAVHAHRERMAAIEARTGVEVPA
jgi:WhiB family redox-sensing transcriptional regulator